MAKTVYLVISDLHISSAKKTNRVNWQGEVDNVIGQIEACISKYRNVGRVFLLMLGDIYDRSYNNVVDAIKDYNRLVRLRLLVDGIYVTMGNHEFSYYANNPFFSLVKTIDSSKVRRQSSIWSPLGLWNAVNVVDRLEDGDVVFHFNHYGTDINHAERGKLNIGLFHQDIVSSEIINYAKTMVTGIYQKQLIDFNAFDSICGYDMCFFGHLHKVFGEWELVTDNVCRLFYLGVLVPPNVSEIDDRFRDRDIPAIIVDDGVCLGVEHNPFSLPFRKDCVLEDVVKEQQSVYVEQKERKQVLRMKSIGTDDPIKSIRDACIGQEPLYSVLEEILSGDDTIGSDLKHKYWRYYGS